MARDNYDPFTGNTVNHDPQPPVYQPRRNTEPDRATINSEGRNIILTDIRRTPGCADAAEQREREHKIRG